jgi:hypothetical protein
VSRRRSPLLAVVSLTLAPMLVASAQSTVTVSPFMSYVPSAATNPLAGFSLTFGGTTGLALRGGAELSVSNPDSAARANGGNRPWGADADLMMFLGGLGGGATVFSRQLQPYLFTGIGLMGTDSSGKYTVEDGWSYGLGSTLPLGLDADLFAEARWRMAKYVLPTANDAPDSKSEMRFGLSFHVGRGSNIAPPPRRSEPRRRGLYNDDDDPTYERERVVVREVPVQQAPPPQVVVVQQPAPPPPQVVVVQQPAPEPPRRERSVNINVPLIIFGGTRTRERETVIITGSECSRRHGRTRCTNDNRYTVPLSGARTTETVVQVAAPSVEIKSERPKRRP